MLLRVIAKSLIIRKKRWAVAALGVLLATSLVAALVNLSLELGSKTGKELEAYGANMLLLPKAVSLPAGAGALAFGAVTAPAYLGEEALDLLESGQVEGITSFAPYLYTVARSQSQVVVVGTQFDRLRAQARHWQLKEDWVDEKAGDRDSIIGGNIAQKLGLGPGDELALEFKEGKRSFRVAGVAEVGGSEDSQVFIDLGLAQALSGREGQLDLVQIRASSERRPLSDIAAELERSLPGAEARVIGQIATAEKGTLSKVQLLLGLVSILVLLASSLTVFSTMSTSVLERTKEIGLMKALGAKYNRIAIIFLAEAWAIGLVGGMLGIGLGLGLGQVVARSVFNTYLSFRSVVIPIALATALLVSTLASLWPVGHGLAQEPVVALRGE